jgi:hypothetical protein
MSSGWKHNSASVGVESASEGLLKSARFNVPLASLLEFNLWMRSLFLIF